MKDILFIGATHGNETIGVDILKKLKLKQNNFDWIIGNPRAYKQNIRYTKTDLNRSAPGDISSNIYEKKRAAQIIKISKNYTYTIDIHGTSNKTGIFIIITNPSRQNLALASMFNIDRIVIWPSITPEMQYPLSEFFSCGLEIECGNKNSSQTYKELYTILSSFISKIPYQKTISDKKLLQNLSCKSIYMMYGNIKKTDISPNIKLKEFTEIKMNNKNIIPIFISTYKYNDIIAYKLKRLNQKDIQNLLT